MSVTRVRALMHRNHLWRAAASLVVSVCVVTLSLGGPASPSFAQNGEVEAHLVPALAASTLLKTGQPMLATATAFLLSGALLLNAERRRRTPAPLPVRVHNQQKR
jgi:hypothetical protein